MIKTHNDVTFQYLCGFIPSSLRVPGNLGFTLLQTTDRVQVLDCFIGGVKL
jgi:hypothetical protein